MPLDAPVIRIDEKLSRMMVPTLADRDVVHHRLSAARLGRYNPMKRDVGGSVAVSSMTGFARMEGRIDGLAWVWELRSVNGKSLDLRFRLPVGFDALEAPLKTRLGEALKRGSG